MAYLNCCQRTVASIVILLLGLTMLTYANKEVEDVEYECLEDRVKKPNQCHHTANVNDSLCDVCVRCEDNDFRRDPYNCSRYYKCSHDSWILSECTGNDTIYWNRLCGGHYPERDAILQECMKPSQSQCPVDPCKGTWPRPCVDDTTLDAPGNCSKYFQCVGGDWYTHTCGDGLLFYEGACKDGTDINCKTEPCPQIGPCPLEIIEGLEDMWEETAPGQVVKKEACPDQHVGDVYRRCDDQGLWDEPDLTFCASDEYTSIWNKILHIEAEGQPPLSAEMRNVALSLQNLTSTSNITLPVGDLKVSIESIFKMAEIHNKPLATVTTLDEIEAIVETTNVLLSEENTKGDGSPWSILTKVYESHGVLLMSSVESYASLLMMTTESNTMPSKEFTADNIVLMARQWSDGDVHFSAEGRGKLWSNTTSVSLENETLASFKNNVTLSTCFFRTLHRVLPVSRKDWGLGGYVVTVNMNNYNGTVWLSQPMDLTFSLFTHQNELAESHCIFWNYTRTNSSGEWDNAGCVVKSSSRDRVVCSCDHMTSFAILVSTYRPEKGTPDAYIQSVLSTVGCGLSIFCLLLTLAAYATSWKVMRSGFAVMLVNLCLSLLLANVIFFIGAGQTENKALCTVFAMILHLLYLVVVFFMLAESVELLLSTILIFHNHTQAEQVAMVAAAWGAPAIIVGITVAISGVDDYGDDVVCWLSTKSAHIWAFIGPLIAVAIVNAIILSLVIRNISLSRKLRKEATSDRLGSSVKNVVVLTPLFGFTWIFGIFAVDENTVAFQYIFIILNSLQGVFIFICHCIMNKRLRSYFLDKLNIKKRMPKKAARGFKTNTVHPTTMTITYNSQNSHNVDTGSTMTKVQN